MSTRETHHTFGTKKSKSHTHKKEKKKNHRNVTPYIWLFILLWLITFCFCCGWQPLLGLLFFLIFCFHSISMFMLMPLSLRYITLLWPLWFRVWLQFRFLLLFANLALAVVWSVGWTAGWSVTHHSIFTLSLSVYISLLCKESDSH